MSEEVTLYQTDDIIRTIRGQKVILDSDLARIYGVEVKRLNEQVKGNRDRFPAGFELITWLIKGGCGRMKKGPSSQLTSASVLLLYSQQTRQASTLRGTLKSGGFLFSDPGGIP